MTKKQKIKFIALLTTTASLAVGSYFFKKKVEKMKEDGTFNTMVFKKRLNQYLKAAKKDELTLEIIDGLLAELDKMNDFKATHEGFELNLDTDKYMKASLVISMIGIFAVGVVSYFYEYIAHVSFGIY